MLFRSYAAQIPGIAGDIASLYQELKPENWRDLPDVLQALPTTERIQQYFLPEEKTSPELQAGITGGNIAALGQGIASLPAAAKGIAKGATAGSKALANEAAYRIYQAMERGEGALAPMLAGVAPRRMIPSGKSVGKTSFEMQHELAQKRAALPVEQGGLGLPPNNTAKQRKEAMGLISDGYHATSDDIIKIDPKKAATNDYGTIGQGFYIDPSKNAAYSNLISIINARKGKESQRIMPLVYDPSKLLDVTDLVMLRDAKSSKSATKNIKEAGYSGTFSRSPSGEINEIAIFDPDIVRSRFAAFDPFRRNAAIAAAMGVAAPDLMAAEPDKKAEGGITSDDLIIEENPL